jgi:glycosyltransferase involved in cell wall biosynthesis
MSEIYIAAATGTIDQPLVSVLVSTYNAERFIQGALESLEQQTIFNLIEIIVIDSGSTQNERAIVAQYQARYGNIHYLRTAREPIYQAWNRGIRIARGRYLTNANTDDRHRNDALEVMVGELEKHPDIALVYADSAVTFEVNQTFDAVLPESYHLRPEYESGIMLTGCHMGPQPMWRRSIHDELGCFREDLRSAGDYEFWCRVALRYQLMHIPQTLCLYYENPQGICNSDKTLSANETRAVARDYQGLLPDTPLAAAVPGRGRKGAAAFVNIGMVTFNRLDFTRQAIASVAKYTDFPYILTVIDNDSQDGTREYLQRMHREGVIDNLLLLDENVGVAKASNLAWYQEPDASHYLKLDNDIVIRKPGWLGKMVAIVDQITNIGVLAYNFEPISYPLVETGGVQIRVKPSGNLGGACILVPHRTWELLGDWCEDYGLYGEEDRDYGFRVSQAGLINAYMADEDIGDHLPAGKAALISATTLAASDGQEERSEAVYRQWKDRQRSEHLKLLGAWERNQFAYSSGARPLRVVSRFVAERKGAVGMAGPTATDSARAFALIAGSLVKKLVVSAKKLGRLLLAAQQNFGGNSMLAALTAVLRVLRNGGLGALRTKALYFLNQTVNYGKWVALYDRLSNEDRRQIDERIGSMPCHPTFSILMPVYRPEPEHLEQAIESVLTQLYPHWELCIADDASDDPRVALLIDSYCQRDTRIKAMSRPQRGHISVASNSCLEMATGEFVALLDHDDLLAPHALYMAAQALNHRPDLSLIYTDEDKINASGVRSWPHFKPDWNIDLMRSENAVNHLGIYRSAIVREVGGFRSGFEGCQDWDLALRVSECISVSQILHLPYVLYHWRVSRQSTAVNTASKQYVVTAGKKALDDHLKRLDVNAEVLPQYGAYFRVKYRLDRTPPVAVISRFAAPPMLERLIDGLCKGTVYPDMTLYLLVETEPRAPLAKIVSMAQAKNLKLILIDCKAGTNSAERINHALSIAEQEVICLLDPECAPSTADWLSELVSHVMRAEIGAAGPKLTNPDGSVYSAGTILGMGASRVAGAAYRGTPKEERGAGGRAALSQNYSAVAAQCLLFRRAVFHEAKGLDPALPLDDYGNVDFCLRLGELGYHVLWTPFAELVWHGSAEDNPENIDAAKIMRSRWQKKLDCDPAHNPNLSLSNPYPMLAPAPRVPRCSAYRPESSS